MTAPATSRAPTRLDVATLVVAAGALLLLVSLFLDWYGPPGDGSGITAWQSLELVDVLLAALALAALYAVIAGLVPRDLPPLPLSSVRVIGVVALVLIVVSMIDEPPLVETAPSFELELGIWLALAGAVLITVGALLTRVRVSFVLTPREPPPPPRPPVPPHDPDTETRPLP